MRARNLQPPSLGVAVPGCAWRSNNVLLTVKEEVQCCRSVGGSVPRPRPSGRGLGGAARVERLGGLFWKGRLQRSVSHWTGCPQAGAPAHVRAAQWSVLA